MSKFCVRYTRSREFPEACVGPDSCLGFYVRGIGKRFVYIIRSDADPGRHYVGITENVDTVLTGTTTVRPATLFNTVRGHSSS